MSKYLPLLLLALVLVVVSWAVLEGQHVGSSGTTLDRETAAVPAASTEAEELLTESEVPVAQSSARVAPETLSAELASEPIDPRIPPNTVFGRVLGADGVEVAAGQADWLDDKGQTIRSIQLLDGGWYFLSPPPEEPPYIPSIRVVADGYVRGLQSILGAQTVTHERFERQRLDFTLAPGGEERITLRFPSGDPVVGATVRLQRPLRDWPRPSVDPLLGTATTDSTGAALVLGLPRLGLFWLSIDLPGFPGWWNAPLDLAKSRHALVVPRPCTMEVQLDAACLGVRGRLSNRAHLSASVLVRAPERSPYGSVSVEGGKAELTGLRLGDLVELTLYLDAGLIRSCPVPVLVDEVHKSVAFDCEDWTREEHAPPKARREDWTRASWRLVDTDGVPVHWNELGSRIPRDLNMSWSHKGETGETTRSFDEAHPDGVVGGTLECLGLRGDGELHVRLGGEDFLIPIRGRDARVDIPMDLAAFEESLVPLVFSGVDEDGASVDLGWVELRHSSDRSFYRVARGLGHFDDLFIRGSLLPGRYSARAFAMGGGRSMSWLDVEGSADGKEQRVRIVFPGHAATIGRIEGPYPVLSVDLRRSDGIGSLGSRGGSLRLDPDGRFSAQDVTAGSYDVVATCLVDGSKVGMVAARDVALGAGRVNHLGTIHLGSFPPAGVLVRRDPSASRLFASIVRDGVSIYGAFFEPGDGFVVEGLGEITIFVVNPGGGTAGREKTRLQIDGTQPVVDF